MVTKTGNDTHKFHRHYSCQLNGFRSKLRYFLTNLITIEHFEINLTCDAIKVLLFKFYTYFVRKVPAQGSRMAF